MTVLDTPQGANIEVRERRDNYAKFIIEPLERGFGITLGNALRRILLSSIPGAAVTYMKIDGVLHEFSTIPGIVEDTIALMLNLKGLPVKLSTDEPKVLSLSVSGPKDVTAADFAADADVEILDPNYRIATLSAKTARLSMEVGIETGRGYVTADRQRNVEHMIGLIPLDSIFSPIRKVNFTVDDTRVGQNVDFDRLTIEIETNGSVTPDEALSTAATIMQDRARPVRQLHERGKAGADGADQRMGHSGRNAQPFGAIVQLPQACGNFEGFRIARHERRRDHQDAKLRKEVAGRDQAGSGRTGPLAPPVVISPRNQPMKEPRHAAPDRV